MAQTKDHGCCIPLEQGEGDGQKRTYLRGTSEAKSTGLHVGMDTRAKGKRAVKDDASLFKLYSWVDDSGIHRERTVRKHPLHKERAQV